MRTNYVKQIKEMKEIIRGEEVDISEASEEDVDEDGEVELPLDELFERLNQE